MMEKILPKSEGILPNIDGHLQYCLAAKNCWWKGDTLQLEASRGVWRRHPLGKNVLEGLIPRHEHVYENMTPLRKYAVGGDT
jgi:hypothetical protein